MSKITLTNLVDLQNETTAVTAINNNNSIIQTAMDNTLSRDGTSPNPMQSGLDMNSFQIVNLPAPVSLNSPLRLTDLNSFIGGGTIQAIPAGGTSNQVLAKNTSTNYDVSWKDESTRLTAGANITLSGTTPVTVATVVSPTFTAPNLGTPSAVNLTNATALPVGSITGTAAGVNTFLATPTSANLATAVTDETGSGNLVFSSSPTLVNPALGTPASGNLVNCTGAVLTRFTNVLGADVALNNVTLFFDGPSVAQGTSGTWFVTGTVTCVDTAAGAAFIAKLWDGTTVVASTVINNTAANVRAICSLSGVITNPAANLKISVQGSATTGFIKFNSSGLSKDSNITAVRIGP